MKPGTEALDRNAVAGAFTSLRHPAHIGEIASVLVLHGVRTRHSNAHGESTPCSLAKCKRLFDTSAMDYVTTTSGERRRIHREYVDVVARFGRDGAIEPVCVAWRDGRSFPIDEVLEAGRFGAEAGGRQMARYRVRLGRHETDLYLERRGAQPALGTDESLRWWVYAYDQVKPGHAPA